MTQEEVKALPTKAQLLELREKLNLSDRQKEIFYLKYGRLWRHIDIAEELGVCQDTISSDVRDIAEKLSAIQRESLDILGEKC